MSDRPPPEGGIWPNDVLAHGTTLNGYRIVRLLGRGGFGVTYLAEDLLGQYFALKEYFPRQFAVRQGMQVHAASADEAGVFDDCRARFVYEARALVGLGRAGRATQDIVRVLTFFEANGTAYMVMEYIIGRTLQAALREHPGGLPAPELRRILSDILGGLAAVHDAGLMHRDIKPANILLRDDTHPVLIDFGSSREARGQQTHGFTQIFSGGYAPPEQILGTRQGPFSDLYAVGAIGYEAIGGKVADALTRQHAASARASDPMPPAAEVGAGRYDTALLAVIDAALALDPGDRPASAVAMARMLADAQALTRIAAPRTTDPPAPAAPAPASPQAPTAPVAMPVRPGSPVPARQRWPWYAGGAAVVAGALALGLWLGLDRAPAPSAPPTTASLAPAPRPPLPPPVPVATPAPARPSPAAPPPPVSVPPAAVIVAPPPAVLPLPPGLDALRSAAASLSCALLLLSQGDDGVITITGPARRDASLDDFVNQARAGGRRVQVATEPLDPGLCPPIPVLAEPVRRERALATLRLELADAAPAAGRPFAATVQGTGGGTLQVDLYGADGTVHHVMRRAVPAGQWSIRLQATASPPAGQQMLAAIASAGSLDLGQRPAHEQVSEYLPLLRRELQRAAQNAAIAPRAELLIFQVLAASPATETVPLPTAVPAPPARTPSLSAAKCTDIVARVQLGEALSDADRTALRTQCKP